LEEQVSVVEEMQPSPSQADGEGLAPDAPDDGVPQGDSIESLSPEAILYKQKRDELMQRQVKFVKLFL